MNIFLVFHGRFPSERASSLFAAKEAASLAPFGEVTLIVPRRLGRGRDVPPEIEVTYLPIIDLFPLHFFGPLAFLISYLTFSLACKIFFLFRLRTNDLVITNEWLPALLATFFSRKVMYEMHDFPKRSLLYPWLFSRVHTILCTNEWKRRNLVKDFKVPEQKLFLERNGVDVNAYTLSKDAARTKLHLSTSQKLVVYTGHLYAHKGVAILARTAVLVPDATFVFVGGTSSDLEEFKKTFGDQPNIKIVGQRPHEEVILWQSAADVLVLPNSATTDLSAKYTSPMKLFEYMASERVVVASRVPAITEILSDEVGYIVEPDSEDSLAVGIKRALTDEEASIKAARAKAAVQTHAWSARAKRIMERLAK